MSSARADQKRHSLATNRHEATVTLSKRLMKNFCQNYNSSQAALIKAINLIHLKSVSLISTLYTWRYAWILNYFTKFRKHWDMAWNSTIL